MTLHEHAGAELKLDPDGRYAAGHRVVQAGNSADHGEAGWLLDGEPRRRTWIELLEAVAETEWLGRRRLIAFQQCEVVLCAPETHFNMGIGLKNLAVVAGLGVGIEP